MWSFFCRNRLMRGFCTLAAVAAAIAGVIKWVMNMRGKPQATGEAEEAPRRDAESEKLWQSLNHSLDNLKASFEGGVNLLRDEFHRLAH
jgi:hypothetical protein